MNPEDRLEIQRRLSEEALLIRHGFEPIPENGGELWITCLEGGEPELWTRAQALAEPAALDRGNRSHAHSLTDFTNNDDREV